MMTLRVQRAWRTVLAWGADCRGASAVEFAIVCGPFFFTLLAILQVGIYFMTQAALDAGVNAEADTLNQMFLSQSTPTTPTIAALQSAIATKAGGLVKAPNVIVDLQPFATLTATSIKVGNGNNSIPPNIGSAGTCSSQSGCGGTILALRAQSPVVNFAPFFGSALVVRSAVLVRRQAQ